MGLARPLGTKPASDSRISPPTRNFSLLGSLKISLQLPLFLVIISMGLLVSLCATETIARNIASLYHWGTASLIHNPL